MKVCKNYLLFLCIALLGCASDQSSGPVQDKHDHEQAKIYTCPMHPQIIRDKPGQCPICGMNLVEKKSEDKTNTDTALNYLLKPTNEFVVSQVKTVLPAEMRFQTEVEAPGIIGYNTKEVNAVSARVSGWIENLYVKYPFQQVTKGQKLFDIYSPELITAQDNLIYLLENDTENEALIKAAENKLILLGLSQEQVDAVKKNKKSFFTITVYSPYDGHLHVPAGDDKEMEDGMNKDISSMKGELPIKEGLYVGKGKLVFNIYNTQTVWALLNIYPEDLQKLKAGQRVIITADGKEIESKLNFIEPIIRPGEKLVTVRCYIGNPGNKLTIGVRIKARIFCGEVRGLYVPATSVLSLGEKRVVFVREGNLFRVQQVVIGNRAGDWTEIVSGIDKNTGVALNAQLLMDSESFVKTNS